MDDLLLFHRVTKFQQKITAWSKVPLSFIGLTNLVKMILIHNCGARLNYFINFKLYLGTLFGRRGCPELYMKHCRGPRRRVG